MSRLTWDEFFMIPVNGRDIELLMRISDLQLMRGPIHLVRRLEDQVIIVPGWMVVKVRGQKPKLEECMENPPTVACYACYPILENDDSIVLCDGRVELYRIYPPGVNLTLEELFGKRMALC